VFLRNELPQKTVELKSDNAVFRIVTSGLSNTELKRFVYTKARVWLVAPLATKIVIQLLSGQVVQVQSINSTLHSSEFQRPCSMFRVPTVFQPHGAVLHLAVPSLCRR